MARLPTNADLARQLTELAQLLAAKGENPYKVRAYRNAAETIAALGESIAGQVQSGEDLTHHAGIGKGIASVLQSLVKEDDPALLKELRSAVGAELAYLKDYPTLDPKRVKQAFKKLGVASIPALREKLGEDSAVKKLGVRTAEYFQRAFNPESRILLFDADTLAVSIREHLKRRCRVTKFSLVGDFRRRVEVIGEIKVLVATDDFAALVADMAKYGGGIPVTEADDEHARFALPSGLPLELVRADLATWGFAEILTTGSASHIEVLNRDAALTTVIQAKPKTANEVAAYKALKLPWIPPELREGLDEVTRAKRDELPVLVELTDLKGDLHAHSTSSDGWQSIEVMAERAREKGYSYLGITDHSQSLKIAKGVSEEDLWKQVTAIDRLNEKGLGIHVLKSAEVDILGDGSLDYPDDLLAELDYTVCSIHSLFRRNKQEQTERILRAMDNPHFGFLGHATGRLLLKRSGYEFDLERVIEHAIGLGRGFEINASPDRLDLSAESARIVAQAGIRIAINTDAHHTEDFEYMRCGVDVARRAGLTKAQVLNVLPLPALLKTFAR